jgi:hypothetical protein
VFETFDRGWGAIQKSYVGMADVRKTALSFPSIYELLPRYKRCCAFGSPGKGTEFDHLSAATWSLIPWTHEAGLDTEMLSRNFEHVREISQILAMPSRIKTFQLGGWQQETASQVYLVNEPNSDPNHAVHLVKKSWQGDGTVLALSATAGQQPDRIPGMIPHDRLMSDSRIIEQLDWALP